MNVFKLFNKGSVCVTGQRGTGKDMLLANVACRRKNHISNVPYGRGYIPLEFDKLDVLNDYTDLIDKSITPYEYPYPEGVDIFISDIGVYFPSQYCGELNKSYRRMPYFLGLSRQLGLCNVHLNTQNLPRAWDKFREQSDTYILCKWCKVLFGKIVIQKVYVYEYYDSCVRRVKPFSISPPSLFCKKEVRQAYALEKERYNQANGNVRGKLLIYINKSNYDTRYFKRLLGGDVSRET